MNRAERRRQTKQKNKPTALHTSSPLSHTLIAGIKSKLQQATSPEDVHHLIQSLVAQGLPPAAGEELHVYAAEFHDATALLQTGGKDDNTEDDLVARLVDNAHDWADATIEQSTQKDQRACRAGCAFCCYLPAVLVTAAETVHLADWLQDHCTPEELTAVKNRLVQRLQSQAIHVKEPIACPLLQDNRCMAYEARPLKCRGWNSLSLEDCEQAYGHSQTSPQVPIDTYAYIMGNTVLNGLSDSLSETDHDGATYELSDALSQAMNMQIPDLVQRWQRGKPMFKKAKEL